MDGLRLLRPGGRLRDDDRGQVLPFAVLLLCGVLVLVFVAMVGLGEGRVGVAALETTADAAAVAAANTAQRVEEAAVTYQDVSCTEHIGHGGRVSYPCTPGPMQTVYLSNASSNLQGGSPPRWTEDAGCSTAAEPTSDAGPGLYGPYCHGEQIVTEGWQFDQNAAEIAAQQEINANLPTLGRYGAVTIQGITLTNGPGQATVTLSLNEQGNAAAQYLHRPVVVEVTGTATPGAVGGGG